MNKIEKFEGEYRFLSNFWPCQIQFSGRVYPSVEHAYQAAKTLDDSKRVKFTDFSMTAAQAKKEGRKLEVRKDWEQVKLHIMECLIREKFSNSKQPPLLPHLLMTDDATLEEGNWWGDRFWGICPAGSEQGENHLGKILMKIREEFQ